MGLGLVAITRGLGRMFGFDFFAKSFVGGFRVKG